MFESESIMSYGMVFILGAALSFLYASYHYAAVRRSYERMYGTNNAEVNAAHERLNKMSQTHDEIIRINNEQASRLETWQQELEARGVLLDQREVELHESMRRFAKLNEKLEERFDHTYIGYVDDEETRPA